MEGKVLVTGGSGFVGSTLIKMLLEKGYFVRTTVRDLSNPTKLEVLKNMPHQDHLEIVQGNLLNSAEMENAVKGCTYVMHIAAPVNAFATFKDENEVIKPAVESTKTIMESSIKYGIKAVVITSSMAAIITIKDPEKIIDETCWAELENAAPYIKEKTLAEKSAWEIYHAAKPEKRPRFSVICPGFILGPTLIKTSFSSGDSIKYILDGTYKQLPKMYYTVVDVRDVCMAHIKAMENPISDGKRYICISETAMWIRDIALVLKEEFGKYGYKISTEEYPECPNKDPKNLMMIRWGKSFKFTNAAIKKDLGMTFISPKEAIIQCAYSMINLGVIPNLIHKK